MENELLSLLDKNLLEVEPSLIRKFDDEISKIPGIVKLTLGEPYFNTPDHIKMAGIKAIIDNQTHYAPNRGIAELREAISEYLQCHYAVSYNPENQIIVTNGATEAISTAMNSFLGQGDVVLCPSPAFGLYRNLAKINGAKYIEIDTENDNYKLTPEKLKSYLNKYQASVKILVLNYPNNPTGVSYSEIEIKELADVLKKYSIFVLSDEIYSELVYQKKHVSIAYYLPEQTLLVNGVSKSYAMTGWRVGYLCGPRKIITNLIKLHQANVATIGTINMIAATEGLINGENDIKKMRAEYEKKQEFVCECLKKIGYSFIPADGAFYVYVKLPHDFQGSSIDYARVLAKKAHVAVIPGAAFAKEDQKYFRISYATSDDNLTSAMKRLEKFMKDG
ncbi:aminotransferase class I/II-fold pyridoxal phosphate-dependent enzyme [Liquorilactobacillus hordei]|uniref:Aminotransferase n=1 Tax=Liquorilactobacillus hordei DSM 19519 TaxID=1423759 RepID=A0A0R1MJ12_9LACO|nr:aminotransferase class I/II-fold pyridoxal phosphate-dependent enzyme [Liquorilactobacillus hordei]KRL05282.1 aspartate tyrosine aromatic aminotransferase [Liquorilactobacillus hordei DSM 19519]QYH52782.1 aminotransferase class I/II-fold pyridoxal phosphate-dependent enzyme [Liquorilactobacillus hordei DSM 19519]